MAISKRGFSRREFLKLVTLSPFLLYGIPRGHSKSTGQVQNNKSPNILILLFDTLTAQHVSLYGYPRETMPNLARFAERATVYHNHYTTGNFTTPATASLLTGTYPWTHRAFIFQDTVAGALADKNLFNLFAELQYYRIVYTHNPLASTLLRQFRAGLDEIVPLQELFIFPKDFWAGELLANDYDIATISRYLILKKPGGDTSSLFLSKLFDRIYTKQLQSLEETYGDLFPRGIPYIVPPDYFLLETAIDWIGAQLGQFPQPFLGYFHLMPPHAPYNTRREFVGLFNDDWTPPSKPKHRLSDGREEEQLILERRKYDEFIPYVDAEFGRLYDHLGKSGLLENTWIIFTSDHGEMFERGILAHAGFTLHHPLIKVPLLISQPGQRSRVDVHSLTSSIDLMPTLAQVSGQRIPDWCEGQALPPYSSQAQSPDRAIYALEAKNSRKHASFSKMTAAILQGDFKLVYYRGYPGIETEFFNLANDPEELNELEPNATQSELQHELVAKLDEADRIFRK